MIYKIIIVTLLLVSGIVLYIFDDFQKQEIKQFSDKLLEKEEKLHVIDSAIKLKKKIDLIQIEFVQKHDAEKRMIEKIDLYKENFDFQFNATLNDDGKKLSITGFKSIKNNQEILYQLLGNLEKDDFVVIKQIQLHNKEVLVGIEIYCPYIKNGSMPAEDIHQKAKVLEKKIGNKKLNLQDLSKEIKIKKVVINPKEQLVKIKGQLPKIIEKQKIKKEYTVELILIGEQILI